MGLVLPDWRLMHPWALHPGRKPTVPVKINHQHPLARGLIVYVLLGNGPYGNRYSDNASADFATVLLDRLGIGFDWSGAVPERIGRTEGLCAHNPILAGVFSVYALSGFDSSLFSDHEATLAVRLESKDHSNQLFSRFDATLDSHYPFGGVFYNGIFRSDRLTLTGVYDSTKAAKMHNIIITSSEAKNQYRTYAYGKLQHETTSNWGIPANTSAVELCGMTRKIGSVLAIWNRSLIESEVMAFDKNAMQLLIPA